MPERKVTYSETAPSNPNVGDSWIHTTTRVEKIWNGTAWEALANLTQGKIWIGSESNKPKEENKPGGGITKAGTATTDVNGDATVTFNTPFPDTNYAILLSAAGGVDTVVAMWNNKVAGGFGIRTEDDGGKAEPNIEVLWLAIAFGNP